LRPEWLVALTQRGATLTVASESLDPLPTFRPSFVATDCEPLCRVIHKLTPALSCSSPPPLPVLVLTTPWLKRLRATSQSLLGSLLKALLL